MSNAIKVCDSFFDVGMYCKMKDSYREFFSYSTKERDDRKTSFIITTHDDCFWTQETYPVAGIELFFFSNAGFQLEPEDDVSPCINIHFDE